jgi:hypothetical protein
MALVRGRWAQEIQIGKTRLPMYTQTTSRIGNMPRRRPEFVPGVAGAEAAKLEKFSAGVPEDASSLGMGAGRNRFLK